MDEFEERLRRLRPARPSAGLKARLAAELEREGLAGAPAPRRSSGKVVWGTTFTALVSAIAAVWAVLLVLDHGAEPPRRGDSLAGSGEAPRFEVDAHPIEQYATLVDAQPSGVYLSEEGKPVQRVALRYLDTEVWAMAGSEETFTVSSYRDEVRVIPAPTF